MPRLYGRPEPLIYDLLFKVARAPVSGGISLREIETLTESRNDLVIPLLSRLVSHGYLRLGHRAPAEEDASSYEITKKGLRHLEELAASARLGTRLPPPRMPPFRSSGLGRVGELPPMPSQRHMEATRNLLAPKGKALSPQEREDALREYSFAIERELSWTNQLPRDSGKAYVGGRNRIR